MFGGLTGNPGVLEYSYKLEDLSVVGKLSVISLAEVTVKNYFTFLVPLVSANTLKGPYSR